jgi:hypothetical protein
VASLRDNAQMWRIEDDLWDNWKSEKAMYLRIESWAKLVEVGHWPDADMLPLGHIGLRAERGNDRLSLLTHDEQHTMMTLWSIARSPLMFGGDLPTLDPFTTSLLTNGAVLAVNQHSKDNRIAYNDGDLRVWTAHPASSSGGGAQTYLAVFNLGDTPMERSLTLQQAGLTQNSGTLHDLWTGKTAPLSGNIQVKLAPHASALYGVSK